MKKIILFLAIFFLFNFSGASFSRALEDTVNVNALVPGEETSPGPYIGGGGGAAPFIDVTPPQIFDVKIAEIVLDSAIITWKTSENSSAYIYYGKTLFYEIGSLQAHPETFISSHEIKLENLEANTRYYFQIRSLDGAGNQSIKDGFEFRTLAARKIVPNVNFFKARAGDGEIFLSWQNPPDSDFQAIKIFRSDKFYPKSPEDGALVYNGRENSFIDKNLTNGTVYYYTAFVFDAGGNYSSGAAAKAVPRKPGQPVASPVATPIASVAPQVSPVPEITNLKLEDFIFTQDSKSLKIIDGKIEAESGKSIIISIDSGKVSELVGTMMFILAQDGEAQTFLFKKDEEKNEYSASFIPPALGGVYSLTIAVLDKKNDPIQAISGSLIVNVAERAAEGVPWYIDLLWIFLIIFIILVLRAVWRIIRKAREKNKREGEKN